MELLRERRFTGEDLLAEALLRRGFLARRDEGDLRLARGSHEKDLEHLEAVFDMEPIGDNGALLEPRAHDAWEIVKHIIAVGEHPGGMIYVPPRTTWNRYRKMTWGHRVSVGPDREGGHGGLDLGVALLVKALPLARVMTVDSCDGHGEKHAYVKFASGWDSAWFWAVAEHQGLPSENTTWSADSGNLVIEPTRGFDDEGVVGLLDDIQSVARRFLDEALIEQLGAARQVAIGSFGERGPGVDAFAAAAREALRNHRPQKD